METPVAKHYFEAMNKRAVIAMLKEHRAELERQGVRHVALFGSLARDEARSDSDIDIMIELDPATSIGVFEYVGIKDYIAGLFDGPVDVVDRDALKPYVRPAAVNDAIYAF